MTFHDRDLYVINSATTHTILKENEYFEYLTLTKANVTTISDPTDMIKGCGRANILLPNNKKLGIKEASYSPDSRRNFLSFKDICANGYHIETIDEDKKKTFILSHVFHVRSLYLKNYMLSFMEFITRS
jgi:hypothetical protein